MGQEQFFEEVKTGDLAKVTKQLVSGGIDIHVLDNAKRTALHVAATYNRPEIVKFLISRGAAIDPKDENDWTPLYCVNT